MAQLGELERAVLDLLWEATEACTAADLRERLERAEGRPLAISTVLTVLSRLERKGVVRCDRRVRPQSYLPERSRDEYVAELMHQALGQAPDRGAALARFVGSATPHETELLRRLLGPA